MADEIEVASRTENRPLRNGKDPYGKLWQNGVRSTPLCTHLLSTLYWNSLRVKQQACAGVIGTHWCNNTVPGHRELTRLEAYGACTARRRCRDGDAAEGLWGCSGAAHLACLERVRDRGELKDQPAWCRVTQAAGETAQRQESM